MINDIEHLRQSLELCDQLKAHLEQLDIKTWLAIRENFNPLKGAIKQELRRREQALKSHSVFLLEAQE